MPYIGLNDLERQEMLQTTGITSTDDLFIDIPENLLLKRELNLESGYQEWELEKYFSKLGAKNQTQTRFTSFKGAGCYQHHVPALVKAISNRGEFLTAYTPYQPEVSQGTLEAIYKFQSFIVELTGMDIANASMYDGATAFAEAITMSWRINKKRAVYLSKYIHPEYINVAKNYLEPLGIEFKFYESIADIPDGSTMVIANPNFYGETINKDTIEILRKSVEDHNLFLIAVVPEAYALVAQAKLAELGADIVCGSCQSFGNPSHYGGAQVGFIASKQEHVRQIPGRIIGKTADRNGKEGYVLTFQAREQHIKRDRASSNICTNQSLHALCTAVYLAQMGKTGLRNIAKDNWTKTRAFKAALGTIDGIEIKTENPFNEFCLSINPESPLNDLFKTYAVNVNKLLKDNSCLFSLDFSKNLYLVTVTELHSASELNSFLEEIATTLSEHGQELRAPVIQETELAKLSYDFYASNLPSIEIPDQGELTVCRYFTRLSQKNFSIDTHFYPLGSCTMKYNPKINDIIASDSAWTNLHPYDYEKNIQGALEVYTELNSALCEITGFHKFSLQPAAGAHGEYSALLMAKNYFKDRKEDRSIVLVPDSAHGTNPASASMAGFKAVSVKSCSDGNVDIEDLKRVLEKYQSQIAVMMLTNPNTFGLFNQNILEVVKLIREDGGLMYYDGANLNAIAGISRPGDMGFDLLHLNLHKTFSTPHGGGGPGAGPIGASRALTPYLPGPSLKKDSEGDLFWNYESRESIGRVRAFNGNFNVLLRALVYIKRNGKEGIKRIAETATLNANYIQSRIKQSEILASSGVFSPKFNRVCKHEFIISAQKLKEQYGITALDVAKRLLDKGIHAPTIYFPLTIPETIMIEPTETEPKSSLDALVTAFEEIITEAQTEEGRAMLKTAPHSTEFSRFDELKAVKEPVLSERMEAQNSCRALRL
ncbi:MAG: aminomethyl-transferring glycine dehydrogenase subunit GcvPB [Candidatus Melainabacteria bacterium]|jgi:glycine dehydrogenase|nr:aminomethyl-transferring glycine dehydrogenase subunit GcvPB [Candidatus Melainabacteria bacterium]